MPFCPNCGNSISASYSFCPNCGAKLSGDYTGDTVRFDRIRIESTKIPNLGGVYEGDVNNGIPNGEGVVKYDNGIIYKGSWKNGKKDGTGVYTWPDGKKYEGEFKDDCLCGQGVMSFPGGSRYEGEFCNDQMNGHGILIYPNGSRYVGGWKDNTFSGDYRLYYTDGHFYEGKDYPRSCGIWNNPRKPYGYYSDEQGNRFYATCGGGCILVKRKTQDNVLAEPFKAYFVIKWKDAYSATLLKTFISSELADDYKQSTLNNHLDSDEHIDVFSNSAYYGTLPLHQSTVYIQLWITEQMSSWYDEYGSVIKKGMVWKPERIQVYFSRDEFEDAVNQVRHWENRYSVYRNNKGDVLQFFTAAIEDFPDLD